MWSAAHPRRVRVAPPCRTPHRTRGRGWCAPTPPAVGASQTVSEAAAAAPEEPTRGLPGTKGSPGRAHARPALARGAVARGCRLAGMIPGRKVSTTPTRGAGREGDAAVSATTQVSLPETNGIGIRPRARLAKEAEKAEKTEKTEAAEAAEEAEEAHAGGAAAGTEGSSCEASVRR